MTRNQARDLCAFLRRNLAFQQALEYQARAARAMTRDEFERWQRATHNAEADYKDALEGARKLGGV